MIDSFYWIVKYDLKTGNQFYTYCSTSMRSKPSYKKNLSTCLRFGVRVELAARGCWSSSSLSSGKISCRSSQTWWSQPVTRSEYIDCTIVPVTFVKMLVGGLYTVGWGKGPWALMTPVKAIRVGFIDCTIERSSFPRSTNSTKIQSHILARSEESQNK